MKLYKKQANHSFHFPLVASTLVLWRITGVPATVTAQLGIDCFNDSTICPDSLFCNSLISTCSDGSVNMPCGTDDECGSSGSTELVCRFFSLSNLSICGFPDDNPAPPGEAGARCTSNSDCNDPGFCSEEQGVCSDGGLGNACDTFPEGCNTFICDGLVCSAGTANYSCFVLGDEGCDASLGFTCEDTTTDLCVDNGGSSNNGGDPHFVSFNNEAWSWHGGCTVVLFRSQHSDIDVHIQTTRVETSTKLQYSYISGVAAKIQSDVFEVLSDDGSIIINGGAKILPRESAFEQARVTRSYKGSKKNIIVYDFDLAEEAAGDGNSSSGGPARSSMQIRANTNTGILYVDFHGSFPDGEGLTGSTSSTALLGRDGKTSFSGHYNSFAEEWQVLDTEQNLFQQPRGPQHPEGCIYDVDSMTTMMQHQKTSSTTSIRRRLMDDAREEVTMEQASEACANVKRQEFCIMDVMAMADLEIAEDPFYQQEQ